MVLWPAIIKYEGDNELTFIPDESAWLTDEELYGFVPNEGDVLIDSAGSIYSLNERVGGHIKPSATGYHVKKDDLRVMIQQHFSSLGQCCVSKFAIGSISEGVAMIGSMDTI